MSEQDSTGTGRRLRAHADDNGRGAYWLQPGERCMADAAQVVADGYERGKLAGRRLGAFRALATARRALRQAGPIALARALARLVSVEDLGEVLRALEDAADRAGR